MLQQSLEELQALGRMVGIGPERCADIKAMEGSIVDFPTLIAAANSVGLYDEQVEHLVRAGFSGGYTTLTLRYAPLKVEDPSSLPPAAGEMMMPLTTLDSIYFHKTELMGTDRSSVLNTMHAGDTITVSNDLQTNSVRTWTLTDDVDWFNTTAARVQVTPATELPMNSQAEQWHFRVRRWIQNIDFVEAPDGE